MAAALAGFGGQALARPPEALACALQAAPAGLDARIADVILSQDRARGRPALDDLRALTDRCSDDQFLTPHQHDSYFSYVYGRMGRDVLDTRLTAEGIPSAIVDQALDIGPGNANNPAEKVTEGDLRLVAEALGKAGHDPARVTPRGWALITAWIVATATMFDGLRDLD
ncbi:hypothetical protein Y88_1202 [Novosphingobium nitrogenifigens DSM 19370]|uniref:Uncharacterized protein n=1 Tax=Novosphingobium nitrogenifigens DSM 19370 TaxID=983920 RepID=F1Z885_9SPHN|nr:hypothetical protein Y88_1202 [Novosphingobium nitrogenifigens DSM 19370]